MNEWMIRSWMIVVLTCWSVVGSSWKSGWRQVLYSRPMPHAIVLTRYSWGPDSVSIIAILRIYRNRPMRFCPVSCWDTDPGCYLLLSLGELIPIILNLVAIRSILWFAQIIVSFIYWYWHMYLHGCVSKFIASSQGWHEAYIGVRPIHALCTCAIRRVR